MLCTLICRLTAQARPLTRTTCCTLAAKLQSSAPFSQILLPLKKPPKYELAAAAAAAGGDGGADCLWLVQGVLRIVLLCGRVLGDLSAAADLEPGRRVAELRRMYGSS